MRQFGGARTEGLIRYWIGPFSSFHRNVLQNFGVYVGRVLLSLTNVSPFLFWAFGFGFIVRQTSDCAFGTTSICFVSSIWFFHFWNFGIPQEHTNLFLSICKDLKIAKYIWMVLKLRRNSSKPWPPHFTAFAIAKHSFSSTLHFLISKPSWPRNQAWLRNFPPILLMIIDPDKDAKPWKI